MALSSSLTTIIIFLFIFIFDARAVRDFPQHNATVIDKLAAPNGGNEYIATLTPNGPRAYWATDCFQSNEAELYVNGNAHVRIWAHNPTGSWCSDTYHFYTVHGSYLDHIWIFREGFHTNLVGIGGSVTPTLRQDGVQVYVQKNSLQEGYDQNKKTGLDVSTF